MAFPEKNADTSLLLLLFLFPDIRHHVILHINPLFSPYVSYLTYVLRQYHVFAHTALTPFPIFP